MSAKYCHTLAAALFNGNQEAVKLFDFLENDGFDALNNGTIDALAGGRVEHEHDFQSSPSLQRSPIISIVDAKY